MNLMNFVAIVVLMTSGAYCYIPRDADSEYSSMPKIIPMPMERQPYEINDRPVYDPGSDKTISPTKNLDLSHHSESSLHQPLNNMDASIDAVRREDISANLNDAISQSISSSADINAITTNGILDLLKNEIKDDENIAVKSAILLKMLEESSSQSPLPIVYLEDESTQPLEVDYLMSKRSGRYYRRYPWKRQNGRSRTRYETEARYLCVPSREDVYKLLVGLHENRIGNHQTTVNFCNRKRPAKAIFTNIRFLG